MEGQNRPAVARRMLSAIRGAFGLENLVSNIVFAATSLLVGLVLRATAKVPLPYLIPGSFGLFLLLVATWLQRTKWHLRHAVVAAETATPPVQLVKSTVPHDPNKEYSATPIHNASGEGLFRRLACGLEDIGNGYDRGVTCEIVSPSGRTARATWNGLDDPRNRRKVAEEGFAVKANEEGPFSVTWRNVVAPEYEPEVIAHEEVILGPTGPLEGWLAHHARPSADEIVLQVDRDSTERGLLQGFQCVVRGPGGEFWADDRVPPFWLPEPKGQGLFSFPVDFREAPPVRDLPDGDYTVYWTAWEQTDSGKANTLDVARDTFHVTRDGHVE